MKKNIIVYGLRKSLVEKLKNNFNISLWIEPNRDSSLGLELLNKNPSLAYELIDPQDFITLPEDLYHEMYSRYVNSISRQFSFIDGMEPLEPYFSYHLAICSSILTKNNPDIVLFANYPHEGIDVILSCLVKFLNIQSVYLSQSLFDSGFFYASKSIDYNQLIRSSCPYQSINKSNINLFYMNIDVRESLSKPLRFIKEIFKLYKYINLTKFANRYIKFKNQLIFLKYNKRYNNSSRFTLPEKYVYFPLHLQPEMTTSCLGKSFANQLLAINKLRKILPDHISIVLKENPKQNYKQRNQYFYKFINHMPNTKFAPISTLSKSLIDKSICVATISGTAGYEALLEQKPCIIFGSSWYEKFEGVFNANLINEFKEIQSFRFSEGHLEKDLANHSQFLHSGYVDPNYTKGHGKNLNENVDIITYKSLLELLNNLSNSF